MLCCADCNIFWPACISLRYIGRFLFLLPDGLDLPTGSIQGHEMNCCRSSVDKKDWVTKIFPFACTRTKSIFLFDSMNSVMTVEVVSSFLIETNHDTYPVHLYICLCLFIVNPSVVTLTMFLPSIGNLVSCEKLTFRHNLLLSEILYRPFSFSKVSYLILSYASRICPA
jgi:hypothetical protein